MVVGDAGRTAVRPDTCRETRYVVGRDVAMVRSRGMTVMGSNAAMYATRKVYRETRLSTALNRVIYGFGMRLHGQNHMMYIFL